MVTAEARDSGQVWTGAGAGGEEYFITGNPLHDFDSGHKSECSYQVLLYFLLNFSKLYKFKKTL